MTFAKLTKLLQKHKTDYPFFALRKTWAEQLQRGDTLGPSRRWWDGEPVYVHKWIKPEETQQYEKQGYIVYHDRDEWCYHNLSYMLEHDFDLVIAVNKNAYTMEAGTCGIEVTLDTIEQALTLITKYNGDQLVLMAGVSGEKGYDKGEIIIADAKAIAVWKITKGAKPPPQY